MRVNKYLTGLGFRRKQLKRLCADDLVQLRTWMRGSATPVAAAMGVLYGLALTMVPMALVIRLAPEAASSFLAFWILILLVIAAICVELCLFAAWAINERILRGADSFYRYGRACRVLIGAATCKPGRVNSRKHLAETVGRWAKEAKAKHVDIVGFQAELDAIVDRPVPTRSDLERVAQIGRLAALALLRGEIDMRALTPDLVAGRSRTRAAERLQALLTTVGPIAALVAAVGTLIGAIR